MQKLFSRHNICLLLPVLLRKGNKTINRWSLRWRSVPRDPRTAGCFSEHISSSHLSVFFTHFKSWCSFPPSCLFTALIVSSTHLYACLTTLFYTGYGCLQLHSSFSSPHSFTPPMFLSYFLPLLVFSHPLLPRWPLAWHIKTVRKQRECHTVRRLLLPWLQGLYRECFLAALPE